MGDMNFFTQITQVIFPLLDHTGASDEALTLCSHPLFPSSLHELTGYRCIHHTQKLAPQFLGVDFYPSGGWVQEGHL